MTSQFQQVLAERMIAAEVNTDAPAITQPPIVRLTIKRDQVVMSRIPEIMPGGGCHFTAYARPHRNQQGCQHNLAADRFGDATCSWCELVVWSPFFVGMGVYSEETLAYLTRIMHNHEVALATQNG